MIIRTVHLAALLAPLLMMSMTAEAATLCERLRARLADLPQTITANAGLHDYTGAISRQNLDLRRARSDLRRLGCSNGSVVIVGGPNEALCGELEANIDAMQTNLETLRGEREQALSGGDTEVTRRRIFAALSANRCDEEQEQVLEAAAREPETHRNILSDLPPISETEPTLRGSTDFSDYSLKGNGYTGDLRTMCVRTCDGAFFPISSHATPDDFQRDAETCQRRCPGAETALYFHELETQESDQMVSAATGEPYSSLPTAFAYKTRDPARANQCGCALADTALNQSTPADGKSIIRIGPAATDDGKGSDAKAENKTEDVKPKPQAIVAERPYDPANSKVRVVGPSFLPSQDASIDLKHPTGPGYQQQQTN